MSNAQETGNRKQDQETGSRKQDQETALSEQEQKEKEKKEKPKAFALPSEIPPDLWESWLAHRREIRKPLKPTGMARCANILKRHPEAAQREIVDYSIAGGYTGLFEERAATRETKDQQQARENDEFINGETKLERMFRQSERVIDGEVVR